MIRAPFLLALLAVATAGVVACSGSSGDGSTAQAAVPAPPATAKASCGPGSNPESSYQGRVTQADVLAGKAITCNTELVGSYLAANEAGTVGGFKVLRYVDGAGHDCAYYDTTLLFPSNIWSTEVGVNVMDMSDPANPKLATELQTPAMLSPHESLVLSESRGILAAVSGNPAAYPGVVDVYDISQDCRAPVLKASLPVGFLGHESGMAPDGKTFYSASPGSPTLTAIDLSNPMTPAPIAVAQIYSHGLSLSDDGNRAYVAEVGSGSFSASAPGGTPPPPGPDVTGLTILDVSQVQSRQPNPTMPVIARLKWDTISIPQNALPVTIGGHPYLVEIDEFGAQKQVGAGRIIDIADEAHPVVVSDLRLEVHDPKNFATQANDPGASNTTVGGYAGHYCNVPSRVDPGIVACSMILSGLRIFDIRDPAHPHEVAYFNPSMRARYNSVPAPASAWAMSSPAFVPSRKEIWYSDGYNGFYVVRVTNGAW